MIIALFETLSLTMLFVSLISFHSIVCFNVLTHFQSRPLSHRGARD
jgi:hypothetical protein